MNITLILPKLQVGKFSWAAASAALVLPMGLVSCTDFAVNDAAHKGTMKTAAVTGGALVGGIIGNQRGRSVEGALLGGGVGALLGEHFQNSVIQGAEHEDRRIGADRRNQAAIR